jgi:hypothetical protein
MKLIESFMISNFHGDSAASPVTLCDEFAVT